MIAAVVLAAGAGTRLGAPKALAVLEGQTLLERAVRTCAAAAVDQIVVVAGCESQAVERAALALPVQSAAPLSVAVNAAWRAGRTGSLQAALEAIGPSADILLLPVDHPCVEALTIDVLLGAFGFASGAPDAVLPTFALAGAAARRGHPIILAHRLRADILALGPDEPLASLVRRSQVLHVPVDDEGILLDVDTPEDLARAAAVLARRRGPAGA